jgi:hypothetical protein
MSRPCNSRRHQPSSGQPNRLKKKDVTRGTQATTLQLTPATEGRNQRGRGPTVQTPSFEKLVTHTQCACRLRKEGYGTLQVLNGRCRHCFAGLSGCDRSVLMRAGNIESTAAHHGQPLLQWLNEGKLH